MVKEAYFEDLRQKLEYINHKITDVDIRISKLEAKLNMAMWLIPVTISIVVAVLSFLR